MLSVSNISKSFGPRILFTDIAFSVVAGDRVAIVGANGVGKSTLLKIILGEEETDSGTISLNRGTTIGFLPQEVASQADNTTILEIALSVSPKHTELRKKIREIESDGNTDSVEYRAACDQYNQLNGYDLELKARKILRGLAFRESDFNRPVNAMSGGWIMRAHIARLLTMEPDLLILDEPTNHLDLETLLWFQEYLKGYPGAILMISHDRAFLNALVSHILEIRNQKLNRYTGNYDDYQKLRQERQEQQLAAHRNQQLQIASLQRFIDRFGAKATKATQAKSKLKQIERMEIIEAPENDEKQIHISFPQPEPSGQRVITMQDIHHAYGSLVVYRGINFDVDRGERVVFVGPNGAGKSTLLKLLAGVLTLQQGSRKLGHNVSVGYYSQNRIDMLNLENTVLEEALDIPKAPTELTARTLLGSFLFQDDDVYKKVSVLSGGEKSRLALVKLLLNPPNLLLMDEPTIHLDIASCDVLIRALQEYQGTLVFISHDVNFIQSLAKKVIRISAGQLTPYAGGYEYYLQKIKASSDRSGLIAGQTLQDGRPDEEKNKNEEALLAKELKRLENKKRAARVLYKRELTMAVNRLEKEIAQLEQKKEELIQKLEQPDVYSDADALLQLNGEIKECVDLLEQKNQEWETKALELEDMNNQ